MKCPIVTDINFLRKRSELIEKDKVSSIVKDLEDSLDLKKGVGLSAIQIGLPFRVGIVRLSKCKLDLWNPNIIEKSYRFRFQGESCLSIPGLYIDTVRYRDIVIENGDGSRYSLEGMEAIVVQHEISHFNGKLIIDKGIKWRKRR